MKSLLLSTALTAGFAFAATAQESVPSPFQAEPEGDAVFVSELLGARIYASEAAVDAESYAGVQQDWEDIGEVNEIVLGRDGTVDAVLIDIGGFLGMGERQVAVDMSALRFVQDDATDADDWFLVLQTDRAGLETAPAWTMSGRRADSPVTGDAAVEEGAGQEGAQATTEDAAPQEGTAAVEEPLVPQPGDDVEGDTAATAPVPESGAREPGQPAEGFAAVERNMLTADELTGLNIHDPSDSSIAEISDIVLTSSGQVEAVVLDVGGFLGIGQKSVAIPMEEVTIGRNEGGELRGWVDMSKEELESLPSFEE